MTCLRIRRRALPCSLGPQGRRRMRRRLLPRSRVKTSLSVRALVNKHQTIH